MFGLYQTREYRVVSVFHRRQTESAAPKGGLWTSLDFMSNNEIGRMPGTRNPGNEKQEHLNTFLGVNLNYRKLIASPVASVRIGTLSLLSWRVTLSTRQIKSSAQGGLMGRFHYLNSFFSTGDMRCFPCSHGSERNRKLL